MMEMFWFLLGASYGAVTAGMMLVPAIRRWISGIVLERLRRSARKIRSLEKKIKEGGGP